MLCTDMNKLQIVFVASFMTGCMAQGASPPTPEYVLDNASGKADGSAVRHIVLRPDSPDATLHIPCNEFFNCDATVDIRVANIGAFASGTDVQYVKLVEAETVWTEVSDSIARQRAAEIYASQEELDGVSSGVQCMAANEHLYRDCVTNDTRAFDLLSSDPDQDFEIHLHGTSFGQDSTTPIDLYVTAKWQ